MKLLFILLTVFSFAAKAPSTTGPVDADIRICLTRPEVSQPMHWTFEVQDAGAWIPVGPGLDMWRYQDSELSILHQSFTVNNPSDSIRVRISCPEENTGVTLQEGRWGETSIITYPGIPVLDTTRIALVGNSFTYCFGADFYLKRLSRLHGHQLCLNASLRGGASMTSHLGLERTKLLTDGDPYDVVFLQDQSTQAARAASDPAEAAKALESCRKMVERFSTNSTDARFIYECTWAYSKSDFASFGSYEKIDSLLRKGCGMVLEDNNGINAVSPIGQAFQKARENGLDIYDPDNHHQNCNGAYLKACVNYLMLFDGEINEALEDIDCGLDHNTAMSLRKLAKEAYDESFVPSQEKTLRDYVSLSMNSENGFYFKGDTIRVTATVKDIPPFAVSFGTYNNGRYKTPDESRSMILRKGQTLLWEQVATESCTKMFAITSGKDAKHPVRVGFIVEPFKIRYDGIEPDDLMEFWNSQIAQMRAQKMKVKTTKIDAPEGFEGKVKVYDAVISCIGNRPAVAIVAEPVGARKGTLPIVLFYHGASMGKSCRATAQKAAELTEFNGVQCLAADINAHGIDNHGSDQYYEDLFNGELKNYMQVTTDISREEYYFRNMFLRDLRVLDYLTGNPLWDGKNIIVTGGSQGGAQSAFIASVEPRVTAMFVDCPAMWGTYLPGTDFYSTWPTRYSGLTDTFYKVMPYYEMANLLKHTEAKCWVQLGQWDSTCPPANILSAYNNIPTEKVVLPTERIHVGDYGPTTLAKSKKSRLEFIKKVIK